jgi:ribosome-associated protein
MKGKILTDFITKVIEEKKGEDIDVINVKKFTTLTDYFVIATSNLPEHGEAIANELIKQLKENGNEVFAVDKGNISEWVALDCGSVIINIMTKEKRDLYNLESLFRNLDLINKKRKVNS